MKIDLIFKYLYISIIVCLLFAIPVLADTTQSRDNDGQKMQGGAFVTIRSASIGTKGFKCFSTLTKIAWGIKVVSSATTDGSGIGFKMFYNSDETLTFPVTDEFYQWQNAPVSKSPQVSKICLRAYSSSTLKTASGVFQ